MTVMRIKGRGQRRRLSSPTCVITARTCFCIAILLSLSLALFNVGFYNTGGGSSSSSSLDEIIYTSTVSSKANDNVSSKSSGNEKAINKDNVARRSSGNKQFKISNLKNTNEHILRILNEAKITSINEEKAKQLPTWEDITSMYGDKPVIHGLETCEHYRNMVKPEDRSIGPAGLFNTGTNLLFTLLKSNCEIDGNILWQAPWGKHEMASSRLKNVQSGAEDINQTTFFPLVMIKDPFSWMNSLCRHSYHAISWYSEYDKEHCPNLIRGNITYRDETVPVTLWTGTTHDSLLDVWNHYYGEEWEVERAKFPHLSIRYEDLLFHGREVSKIACECVGGSATTDFQYVKESAKGSEGSHKGSNDLIKALLQYGDPARRLSGFTDRDLQYARNNKATVDLMKKYVYSEF